MGTASHPGIERSKEGKGVQQVSAWSEIVTWVSMFLAASAGWANLYGVWVWRGRAFVQLFYGAVAMMAWMYAAGYVWLIVSGNRLEWSNLFGNLGPIVWLLVWNVPPIAAAKARRQEIETLRSSTTSLTRAMDNRQQFELKARGET